MKWRPFMIPITVGSGGYWIADMALPGRDVDLLAGVLLVVLAIALVWFFWPMRRKRRIRAVTKAPWEIP